MDQIIHSATQHIPWNRGKLVGQKAPLKPKEIWAIRIRLQLGNRTRWEMSTIHRRGREFLLTRPQRNGFRRLRIDPFQRIASLIYSLHIRFTVEVQRS
jgi:hypothetical protein